MLAYYGTRLSPHMDRTPEGYLICRDVPIARTGPQQYLARELRLEGDPERVVTVNRHPEDVFDAAVLASFEGKDVTAGHPPENVGPENHAAYSKGHVQNVRRDGDHIVADLIIKDAGLVSDIWNGTLREVSCGYLCQYVPDGDGYKQQQIRGNHVAVVPRGRAGHEVAIKDSAGTAGKGNRSMSKFAEAVLKAFGMAAHEAETPAEVEALIPTAASALDAAPEEKPETRPEEKPEEEPDKEKSELREAMDALTKRLEALEAKDKAPGLHDEKAIDAMIEQLGGSGEKAVTIPADDAAVTLLKAMRPVVAGIKDEADRSRVVDALLSTIKGPDMVGQVVQAVQANAQQAADAAQASTFEARCRESEAAYAARNPHKKKED